MDDDQFLTTDEVLGYLQVNLRTVYRLIKAGSLPAKRVGRQYRFRKNDIDDWLEQNGRSAVVGRTGRPRVLIVDDDEDARESLGDTLSSAQYDVDAVPDGASAVARLKDARYDLMITDLRMAKMDGLSVIREARQRWSRMPIIIVTGFSTEASAIEAVNLHVSGYLTKPLRKPQVLATAARALGRKAPRTDAQRR